MTHEEFIEAAKQMYPSYEEIQKRLHKQFVELIGQRIDHWIDSHEIACISAFRLALVNRTPRTCKGKKEGEFFTIRENDDRRRELNAALLYLHYDILRDDFERGVNFNIVVNLQDDDKFYDNLFRLSEYYNQDGFIYKPKGSSVAYLVGTNGSPNPGYGNRAEIGKIHHSANHTVDHDLIGEQEKVLAQKSHIMKIMQYINEPPKKHDDKNAYGNNVEKLEKWKCNMLKELDENITQYFVEDSLDLHNVYGKWAIACISKKVINYISKPKQ